MVKALEETFRLRLKPPARDIKFLENPDVQLVETAHTQESVRIANAHTLRKHVRELSGATWAPYFMSCKRSVCVVNLNRRELHLIFKQVPLSTSAVLNLNRRELNLIFKQVPISMSDFLHLHRRELNFIFKQVPLSMPGG